MNITLSLNQRRTVLLGEPVQVAACDNSTTEPRVSVMTEFIHADTRGGQPTGTSTRTWVDTHLTPSEARALAQALVEGADQADMFTAAVTR